MQWHHPYVKNTCYCWGMNTSTQLLCSSFRPSRKFLKAGSKPDWLGPFFPKSRQTVKTANSHSQMSPVAQQKQRPMAELPAGCAVSSRFPAFMICHPCWWRLLVLQLSWSDFPPADNLLPIFLWVIPIKLIGSPRKKNTCYSCCIRSSSAME